MDVQVIEVKKPRIQKQKVAAYCRVSKDDVELENSLENQKQYYENLIRNNPEYEFAGIYWDYAVSGYKENRPSFQELLKDARAGKIDLIITKSITRFARNTDVFLRAVRELKELNIGVFFELQNINSLDQSGELLMTVYAAFAQGESETYSQLCKMAYIRKYEKGEPIHYLERSFGYGLGENGEIVIVEEEAHWVKVIFEMAADGYSLADIKRELNRNGVKTKKGYKQTESSIKRIIENEIYMGDYIMHKNFVDENRKLRRNRGEVKAWYIEDDHDAIVTKALWRKAQAARARKREYLDAGNPARDNCLEEYAYKDKLFCKKCGYPLRYRSYSNGNRVSWDCTGRSRFKAEFCEGIHVPDTLVKTWVPIAGPIFIEKKTDKYGKPRFLFQTEAEWSKHHAKKAAPKFSKKLTKRNYPYLGKIYCDECGYRLTRHNAKGKDWWVCSGTKHKGKGFCKGVRIPDEKLRQLKDVRNNMYFREEIKDGEKYYSYTCEERDRKGSKADQRKD